MNVSKVKLPIEVIKAALVEHIDFLIERKDNPDKFSKFDSENDAFLGACGEYAFAKYLSSKGFIKESDYLQVNKYRKLVKFKEHFKDVNGILYDKYDFTLNLFNDQKGNPLPPLKIDVKTQKYVGTYTDEWQFAVNSNTIDQVKKDENKIDFFLFIFSKDGLSDVIDPKVFDVDKKSLENLKKNITPLLKKTEIEVDLLGMIKPSKFIALSQEFKKGEIFRMNNSARGINSFKAFSPMHRIFLNYLDNTEKLIIPKKINNVIDPENINGYVNKIGVNKETMFATVLDANNQTYNFPVDKVYENSQHKDFNTFVNSMLVNRKKQVAPINKQGFKNK